MTQDRPSRKRRPSGPQSAGAALDKASADLLRRIPPQNLEAEQAVLGGIFLKTAVFHEVLDVLAEDDFYSPAHRAIYAACCSLFEKSAPIDLVTVAEELGSQAKLETVGGAVYLAELAASPVSASNALYHAKIVKDKAVLRKLIETSGQIIASCFDSGGNVDGLLDESEQAIFRISESRTKNTYMGSKELVGKVFRQLEELYAKKELVTGVPTGYHKLDEITAGLQPSDLIIVAGRPSMGKTAFALNLALRAASHFEVPSAVFSLEMSMDQLMMRMLCIRAKVDLGSLRRGFINDADWARLFDAAQDLSHAPIFIDDTPALSTLDLRARCRRLKSEKKLGLVVVDYLQLMRASRFIDSREQEISDISRSLKALAKELHVPVIALSQLNRKVEERTDKRPKLSDLRESGAIEQDADVIMFLYRDAVYNKQEDNPKANIAEVIIGKQRNGPIGEVELIFLKESTSFEDMEHAPAPSEYSGN